MMESRRSAWLALVLAMAGGGALATEPLATASSALAAGNYGAALHELDNLPQAAAASVSARFLRATALMGSERLEEAAALFEALVAEHPHMPEAYNNLAAIYVRQGRLDEAKQLLERALATDRRYATVYENLSAIYVEQARSSYAKALRLEAAAQAPQLAVMTALPSTAAPVSAPLQVAAATVAAPLPVEAPKSTVPPPPLAPAPPQVAAATVAPPPPVEAPKPVAPPVPAPAVTVVSPAVSAAPVATAAVPAVVAVPERLRLAVLNALEGWARAWSEQNPEKYLAYYAADYAPEDMARSAWEDERRARLSRPAWIKVTLEEQTVEARAEDEALVTLKQRYASPNYKDVTLKRLTLALREGNWVITEEASLKVRR